MRNKNGDFIGHMISGPFAAPTHQRHAGSGKAVSKPAGRGNAGELSAFQPND